MHEPIERYLSSGKAHMDALGLHVERAMIRQDFPLHTHDFCETFIIVSGTATHVLGEWEYPLKRGDVYAVKGDVPHGFRDVRELDIINLMYKPSFFAQAVPEIRAIPGFVPFFLLEPAARSRQAQASALTLSEEALQYVTMMVDFIITQQARATQRVYPVLKLHFGALASYLATQYDVGSELPGSVALLNHAAAFMEQHLSEPIKVADVARSVCLSPRQLERLFGEHYGKSPMKYLRELRLKHALALLTRTDGTVADAAHASGFDDVSYFIRVFHSAYGITPNMARRYIHQG